MHPFENAILRKDLVEFRKGVCGPYPAKGWQTGLEIFELIDLAEGTHSRGRSKGRECQGIGLGEGAVKGELFVTRTLSFGRHHRGKAFEDVGGKVADPEIDP